MSADAKHGRGIGAEAKEIPGVRSARMEAVGGGGEAPRRSPFLGRILLVAGISLAGCGGESPRPVDDADADAVQDVDEDVDSALPDSEVEADIGPEADVAPEDVIEAEAEDGEAEAGCPSVSSVEEPVEDPGHIGSIVPVVTETYESVTECDGGITRGGLLETGITLPEPASADLLGGAIGMGAEIPIFGEMVRLTLFGLEGIEYERPVYGAEGDVEPLGSVDDGVHRATARSIGETSVLVRLSDVGGGDIGDSSLGPGQYAPLPSGRIVLMTDLRFNDRDPLRSRCHLAILEAPVNVPNGGRVSHGGREYVLATEAEGADMRAARLVGE